MNYLKAAFKDYSRIIFKRYKTLKAWVKKYRTRLLIGALLISWGWFLSRPPEVIITDTLQFEKVEAKAEVIAGKPYESVEAKFIIEQPKPPAPMHSAVPAGCVPGNPYASHIYFKESGCNPDRWNGSGCYGLGQACPASKIAHCGADFACQHAWFSNYATSKYGSWEAAYAFWLAHSWW